MISRANVLDSAKPGSDDEPDDAPPDSAGDSDADPMDQDRRAAGDDLRTALQGDDGLEVFKAWEHCMSVRELAEHSKETGEEDEAPKKSALVIAIGKARPQRGA